MILSISGHGQDNEVTIKEVTYMGQDEKIREAQEILDWAIMHLNLSIKCKVVGYKHGNYRVQVLKGDRLLMPIQIAEEEVKEANPKENFIPDKLKTLLKNLENY
jgi:hypothetical protein